ncbi:hypothetical protein LJC49_05245 [Ruminococcaceae bacterium OttesenSCG-928-I18]|nr:hypothetical protein [Ruminococcaceae bacterium OttesenSCG-928-I18]
MNLYHSITRRKSCRSYQMQPLEAEWIDKMQDAVKDFEPLYPGLPLTHRLTKKVTGRFQVQAPHYLIISGQGAPGEMEQLGFLYEQLVLWFDAMEIGCVWLGASKDAEASARSGDIIVIGFGRTAEPVHRTRDQFNRKPIEDITNAPDDVCIQAAHLAPSGMNTQPWYFEKAEAEVLVYKQKLKPPVSLLYKHSDIDMGIGLCHYALACKETGRPFRFTRENTLPGKAGYLPFGRIG